MDDNVFNLFFNLQSICCSHRFPFPNQIRFNTIKGFGFIVPDDGSDDIFVHQTAIKAEGFRSLADGEVVEFLVEEDDNGRRKASKVTGPEGSNVQGAPFRPQNDYDGY